MNVSVAFFMFFALILQIGLFEIFTVQHLLQQTKTAQVQREG